MIRIFLILSILIGLLSAVISTRLTGKHVIDDLSSLPSYSFPEYDYHDIMTLDQATSLKISHDLTSLGFLQIKNIPKYAEARQDALKSSSACFQNANSDNDTLYKTVMNDGSKRLTASGQSSNGIGQKLSSACAETHAAKLRALIDNVTKQLFRLLDSVSASHNIAVIEPYRSHSDVINHGDHLEHLHVYYPAQEDTSKLGAPTIDMHTDNGIMIAMTTGYYQGESRSDENGLYIELPTGKICRAMMNDDSLIIMVGAGSRWMSPILGAPLRPVPHAMIAGYQGEGSSRAWFGKMILPPFDAVIQDSSDAQLIEFGIYRRHLTSSSDSESLPTGCGSYDGSNPYIHLSTSQCIADDGTTGLNCWQDCQSVADLPCGLSAQCVYLATNEVVDGDGMCPGHSEDACKLECVNNPSNSTFSGFCYGTGVSMLMDGFTMMAFSDDGTVPCINMLFTEWTLDSKLKFAIGCVGVFFASMLVQYMTSMRQHLKRGKTKSSALLNTVLTVLLYGIQVVLSYFLMLTTMTYSVEIFTMVCAGLTVGYAAFNLEMPPSSTDQCCDLDLEEDFDKDRMYQTLPDTGSNHTLGSLN